MRSLQQTLAHAQESGTALGHFNVADFTMFKAVCAAAAELNVPVLLGLSESEREFIGVPEIVALVSAFSERSTVPIYLSADHTHSLPKAIEAVRAGFDMVVFDLSALPFDENIARTREALRTLKAINPQFLVEGEIGDIGAGSFIHVDAPTVNASLTGSEEARRFVIATGVDILAPAVGNFHGMRTNMLTGQSRKRLDVQRIREIKRATGSPITLHGGSATDDEDLRAAIEAGINIIHINTELRVAWRKGLESTLSDQPGEKLLPTRFCPPSSTR
jgi:fructose-bisphosphate aldolase, class II